LKLDTERLLLDLKGLPRGTSSGNFRIPLEAVPWEIEGVEPAGEMGILELTVDLEEGAVICSGILKAEFRTPCARCLEPAVFEVTEPIMREYTWSSNGREEDEVEFISESGQLDLMDAVREAIILSIPGKALCSPDCPGIDYI
jgi:uncharacterized metal-binding protein YceD (DUF177 family)